MSTIRSDNRLDELQQAIIESTDIKILDPDIRRELKQFGEDMKAKILLASPDGSNWTDPTDVFRFRRYFPKLGSPRPSLRQHGITFKEGIQTPIITPGSGVKNKFYGNYGVEIPSTAPHAQVVIDGRQNPRQQRPIHVQSLFYFNFRKGQIVNAQSANTGTTPQNKDIQRALFDIARDVDNRWSTFFKKNALKPIKKLFGAR